MVRELRTIGAAGADAEAYVQGVRRGRSHRFRQGSGEKVDAAAEIMNRHRALELEELGLSEPHLHSADRGNMTPGSSRIGIQ